MHPCGGITVMSNWEEAIEGQTQNMLEDDKSHDDMETPQGPTKRAGRSGQREGCMGYLAQYVGLESLNWISGKNAQINGWKAVILWRLWGLSGSLMVKTHAT